MNYINPIVQTLESMGVIYTSYHHQAVYTVEEASIIEDHIPAFHTKNLFLVDKKGGHHLVCISAHQRLRIKDFGRHYGLGDLSFGSQESMMHELRTTPGSVSLFGIIYQTNTTLYLDPSLIDQPAIGRHPNDNTQTLVISRNQVELFLRTLGISKTIIPTSLLY